MLGLLLPVLGGFTFGLILAAVGQRKRETRETKCDTGLVVRRGARCFLGKQVSRGKDKVDAMLKSTQVYG